MDSELSPKTVSQQAELLKTSFQSIRRLERKVKWVPRGEKLNTFQKTRMFLETHLQELLREKLTVFLQESSAPDGKQQQISKAEATTKMKRVWESCIGLETAPFPRVVADRKTTWWKGQSCLYQQQESHSTVPFLMPLSSHPFSPEWVLFLKINYLVHFLHPSSIHNVPWEPSTASPPTRSYGDHLQLLVFLAWTIQHHAPKLLRVGRKRTLFSLTPWNQGIHVPVALALMPNLLTSLRTYLLHLRLETHGATGSQITASTSPCCKNYPCTVEDLDEQCRQSAVSYIPLTLASIVDPPFVL